MEVCCVGGVTPNSGRVTECYLTDNGNFCAPGSLEYGSVVIHCRKDPNYCNNEVRSVFCVFLRCLQLP